MNNIRIIYILSFLNQLWFWLGVWVFYYLMFTDYAGIGLIESVMIFSLVVFEIPSGAISDMLGKKNALLISFSLLAIGNMIMALASSYGYLLLSVFILSISAAFYSGSAEALAYDSIKYFGLKDKYEKVVSNMMTLELLALAMAGAIGGFMYAYDPTLPFWMVALVGMVGLLASLFLKEPPILSGKFIVSNFIKQNKEGIKQLFKSKKIKQESIMLLSIGFFLVISYEMLNDVLAVEFGFKPTQLGILWSVLALAAAGFSQITPYLNKRLGLNTQYLIFGAIIAISLFVSPFVGLILGGISIAIRIAFQAVFKNLISITINNNTESKFRATTLSAFNLLKNLPYVFVAYPLGSIMDIYSARVFALALGIVLFLSIIIYFNLFHKQPKNTDI